MNGFINTVQAQGIRDIPIVLPQTEIRRNSAVVIQSFEVEAGERVKLKWLGMQVLQQLSNEDDTKVTAAFKSVYVGIWSGMEGLARPAGAPIMRVGADVPSFKSINPYYVREFTAPDHYQVVLVNNTLGNDYDVVVTGVLRLEDDA